MITKRTVGKTVIGIGLVAIFVWTTIYFVNSIAYGITTGDTLGSTLRLIPLVGIWLMLVLATYWAERLVKCLKK